MMNRTTTAAPLSAPQSVLYGLIALHLLIIAASNYLVQIPVDLFGVTTTWGTITFPFIFLATDLTVRIFGAPTARRIIFAVMLPALLLSYVLSVLFSEGQFQGWSALATPNIFVARIALASFLAYSIGQLLDIAVFSRLRQQNRAWWIAPTVSSTIGTFIDTLIFFAVAFYKSPDAFMAAHWPEIAAVDYGFKLALSLLLFVPAYGVLMASLADKLTPPPQRARA